MKQRIFQIDAFTDQVFSGNPAAVCIMDQWLDDGLMQQIAEENNLSETAFVVKNNKRYEIRWFTPEVEVDLCGHATLATAYVLFNYYDYPEKVLKLYSTRSGDLAVEQADDNYLTLDFPTDELTTVEAKDELNKAIGAVPLKTIKGKHDYLLVYNSQKEIEQISPNYHLLDQIDCRGVIVSAPGQRVDFVSRAFFPNCGIPEDPVTGSAHTTLIPYWWEQLKKPKLTAEQISPRGGYLLCEYLGERVKISGKAIPYMIGEIQL
ncbi:MAG: PhzF family phenazine biosynthesis protein [Saonia sp.]